MICTNLVGALVKVQGYHNNAEIVGVLANGELFGENRDFAIYFIRVDNQIIQLGRDDFQLRLNWRGKIRYS